MNKRESDIPIGKCATEANVPNWGIENEKETESVYEIPKERKKRTMFDKARLSIKNKKVFLSYKKDQEETKKDNSKIEIKHSPHHSHLSSYEQFVQNGMQKIEKEKAKEIKEVKTIRNLLMKENPNAYNDLHLFNTFKTDKILLDTLVSHLDSISRRYKSPKGSTCMFPPVTNRQQSSISCQTHPIHKIQKKTKSTVGPIDLLKQIHDMNNNYMIPNDKNMKTRPTPTQFRFRVIRHLPYYGNTETF